MGRRDAAEEVMKATVDPQWFADQESASLLEDDFGPLPDSPTDSLTVTAFDDLVTGTNSVTVGTNPELDTVLGAFDQLVIQVVADIVSGTSVTLACRIVHSGDGQSYVAKRPAPEVPATALAITGSNSLPLGYDDGTLPSLAFVRVNMTLAGTGLVSSHVVCTITGNNVNPAAFSQKAQQLADSSTGTCVSTMQAGTKTRIWQVGGGREAWFSDLRIEHALNAAVGNDATREITAGLFPFQTWFRPLEKPTTGRWVNWQLKSGYHICFHTDGSLAVMKGVQVAFQTRVIEFIQVTYNLEL
jgi:hypothetical protein